MTAINRADETGAWHHVTNRGLSRRSAFETNQDKRYFLSRIARCVRDGHFEVHAFAILTTHFHLLVRSLEGGLSRAMQRSQNSYVRWFNRLRRRDGPLFRGRFRSKRIESEEYWDAVVRYIDRNAVEAGIVPSPWDYPFCSAFHYTREKGPIWLQRCVVESDVRESTGAATYSPQAYSAVFHSVLIDGESTLVEQGLLPRGPARDEGESLADCTPEGVLDWMRRKALLADGTLPGIRALDTVVVRGALREEQQHDPHWHLPRGRLHLHAWQALEAGLLRYACGLRLSEIGRVQESTTAQVRHRMRIHDEWLLEDLAYGRRMSLILSRAISRRRVKLD